MPKHTSNIAIPADIKKAMVEEILKQVDVYRVDALMLSFCLVLHRRYGYDETECIQILNDVDAIMGDYLNNAVSLDGLRETALAEVNLTVDSNYYSGKAHF